MLKWSSERKWRFKIFWDFILQCGNVTTDDERPDIDVVEKKQNRCVTAAIASSG